MKLSAILIGVLVSIAGAGIGAFHLQSLLREPAPPADVSISSVGTRIRPDRRLEIGLVVANRGGSPAGETSVWLSSSIVEHHARLAPLASRGARTWSWISPALPPGDYELVIEVAHEGLDLDESNNIVRRILHVPIASAAEQRGPLIPAPGLIGLGRTAAARALHDAGMRPARWYQRAKRSPVDRIAQQWPEPGTLVPRGTRMVIVSDARETVPSVVGLDWEQARSRLKHRGFVPGALRFDRQVHYANRSVLDQGPHPGTPIAFASPVTLEVSEPRTLWPVVVGGAMCLLGLMTVWSVGAGARRATYSPVSRDWRRSLP